MDGVHQLICGQVAQLDIFRAEMMSQPGREPERDAAALAIHDDGADPGPAQLFCGTPGVDHRVVAGGRPAVGHQDEQGPPPGIANAFLPQRFGGTQQPLGERRTASARQVSQPPSRDFHR